MEDSACRLSALETTGWKPVVHDRLEAYLPRFGLAIGEFLRILRGTYDAGID